jgi:hypothetical protein
MSWTVGRCVGRAEAILKFTLARNLRYMRFLAGKYVLAVFEWCSLRPTLNSHIMVILSEGGKPENLEKNPRKDG